MKKKNLVALLLSLMMATSTTAAFTSCGDDESSSSSSSSSSSQATETEELKILNSDFETYEDKDGVYPMVTTVEGWTYSKNTASTGTALESKSESGIIDTQDKAWDNLTTSGLPEGKTAATLTAEEAESYWDDMTAKDKIEFYEAWELANPKKDIEDELDFYEYINIDESDLLTFDDYAGDTWATIENPRTHDWEGAEVEEDEYGKTDTKVLMLRNNHSSSSGDFIGTAAKYTSTTNLTVEAGTYAEFSVWVKTANLRDERNETVVDKGAYIQITHALGNKTQEPLVIKNINTEGVTDNNGWVQYSFVLKASPFTNSSFTIVLGLGMSGGTNRLEYVNGVAFFDDITCETYQLTEEYQDPANTTKVTLGLDDKVYEQNETPASHYTIDFTDTLEGWNVLTGITGDSINPTTEERSGKTYSSVAGQNPYPTLNGGFAIDKDIVGVFDSVAALNDSTNVFAKAAYNDFFKDKTYLTDEQALILFSAQGAAYTAKSADFSLAADEYKLFSFFVKTSEMNGLTGAGIKLVDNEGNPAISALDSNEAVKIEIDETDIHDGWTQCFFFIHNDSGLTINNLHFEFTYGPTTIIDTAKSSYQPGFAVFTHFQQKTMTDKEFECAVSGEQAKIVTLSGEYNVPAGDSGFGTPVLSQEMNIKNGYALPTEYTGVYNDSVLVGGTSTVTNAYANAGLLASEYADNYSTILDRVGDDVFSDPVYQAAATRPLVIESSDKAYGFIGNAKSVASNTLTAISLRVKVSGNAKANVYLIDTSDEDYGVLSVERNVTYWYDEEGNVLAKNPNDDDFWSKKHTALYKQDNGLYKVNPDWEFASSVDANAYFANLQAYEYDEKSGHLLLDSKTTYNYNDDWKHDGNDGYAFYSYNADEKSAFAYSNNTTKVLDFSTITNLTARYEAKQSDGLSVTVENTNGNWAEIIFYVKAGSTAKSYRLEVWNGSRDANVQHDGTNGYVAFDVWSVGSDSTTVNTWLENAKENLTENEDYFESVFSFYDHGQYLRYDATLDHNEVGDAFESYVSATDGDGIAYLHEMVENTASNGSTYKTTTTYADFTFAETTQSADPVESETETDDDDSTDTDNQTNPWLLASSIIIAAVLLFAVISLIVRKVLHTLRKKRGVVVKSTRIKKEKKSK